ncbi:MAG: 4-hydroxythreonine-4-phosphate dehydrogenase PdxA [Halofilum sp. (in: g-proteobacteria)]|nr:4-hydroxythreonine-4-phosphate dehydrogenase PdxA [Halofilum sp. (in: g-proteobacteria)]
MVAPCPRIAITAGEPAGIGPELVAMLAARTSPGAERVLVGNGELLAARARQLRLALHPYPFDAAAPPRAQAAGEIALLDLPLARPVTPGRLDPANAEHVLETLARATDGCLAGDFDALVTAPVHKGVINDAGTAFSGHTEFLGERSGGRPVMLLVAGTLRVALVTTHLPLRAVPDAITPARIEHAASVLEHGLRERFGLTRPRIDVLGLNPHAGEGGHLGGEERAVIEPTLERLRARGLELRGPLPADTAFTPGRLAATDAVLAMYHDQGLPVLKHVGFGRAVNVTLGLPFVRTSVDHGTALDLAGSGRADPGSLLEAFELARWMVSP